VALLEGLCRQGHEVVLYCNYDAVAEPAAARGITTRKLHLGGDIALHHAWRFARELRRSNPDALILGKYKKIWLGGLSGRLAKVPRVVVFEQLQRGSLGLKYRFVLGNWVDVIVVNANSIRDRYIEFGFRPERLLTIYNGFEFREPSQPPGTVRQSLGIPAGPRVLGSIGRLVGMKRFDRLLRAIALLPRDVHCVIAGDGRERTELESLGRKLGIGDRLHLLGWRQDIPDVLQAFDVMVTSSDNEGLSIAITEAMAAGIPVVSTPVSGSQEAFEVPADQTAPGVIVDFDARAIADEVSRLLGDPVRRRAMGEAGRRIARERFSFDSMLDRWETVLRSSK